MAINVTAPLGWCAFCFACACQHHGLILRCLSQPAIAAFAPLAYSTYLLQWLGIYLCQMLRLPKDTPLFYIATVTIVVPAAYLLHHAVERPFAARVAKPLLAACEAYYAVG